MPKLSLTDCHVSDAVRRLNPELFGPAPALGAVPAQEPKPAPAQTLDRIAAQRQAGAQRVSGGREGEHRTRPIKARPGGVYAVVTFVRYGKRALDDDNLAGSCKPIRDAVAAWLGIDDGDPRIRWEYGQVETRGAQGVSVKVECL